MMIKVSNEFLDFDEEIEVEKQIKLFEDISTTDGDFSYAFDLPKTLNNTRLLQNPLPDNINKPVYQQIPAKLLSDSGAEIYNGYLRIEKINKVYQCSFFGGNNNWFSMISGRLSDLDLSIYDIENTEVNIINSWSLTDGLVFPLIDAGGLITRSYYQLKIEDFVAGFYVKTLFDKIFTEAGIKIKGNLVEDWRYQHALCITTANNDELIKDYSSYVNKDVVQVLPYDTITKITWTNDSTEPFYDGSANAFDLPNNRYVAPIKMSVKIDVTTVFSSTGFLTVGFQTIRVNGVDVRTKGAGGAANTEHVTSQSVTMILNAGDVVEFYQLQVNSDGDAGNIHRGTVKITPLYIYKTLGTAAVPNWTKQQFVSNILRMFNVLASYNEGSATLTLDLFEKIKSKQAIDLSEHISDTEVDYSEFISDYGQKSKLSYNEVEFEQLKTYNKGKFFKYGQGVIEVDNEFLSEEEDILSVDFSNPIAYLNPIFDSSLELTNLIELEEGEEFDYSDVANDGYGDAAFNIGSSDPFNIGDLVRVKDSTNELYNGDWIVKSTDGIHVVFNGLPFDTGGTGKLVKLNYVHSSSEDVFLVLNIPNYPVSRFSSSPIVFDSGGFYPIEFANVAFAYFDLINTGKQVNEDFIYSMSFGGIDDPLHYQVTMVDSYFRLFSRVLNDPAKLFCTCRMPYALFVQFDFLSPIKIRTMETTNEYYLNRITGYKESYLPCTLELIKI